MGYSMAGHLSKNKDFDLYVYNRTDEVADKWLNKHDTSTTLIPFSIEKELENGAFLRKDTIKIKLDNIKI